MAACEFDWIERNGAAPGTQTPSGTPPIASLARADFLSVDESSHSDADNYKAHPIIIPTSGTAYSFEKWLAAYWTFAGSNEVGNVKFWKSSGTLSHGDLIIKYGIVNKTSPGYDDPVNTVSTNAVTNIPTAEPGSPNVTLDGGNASITASAYSDYIVLQLHVPSTVNVPGDIGTQELTMQYDES